MAKLRIGYVPNSPNLNHPADRRRIVHWAKNRGHEIVLDLNQKTDLLFLSSRANFPRVIKNRGSRPVVIDLVDGYLGNESWIRDWVRGTAKVVTGQISDHPNSFRNIVAEACQLSNAVVCETPEQSITISPYSKNVHAILDFHEEFPFLPFNETVQSERLKGILWEGLPFTISGLREIQKSLIDLGNKQGISLEVVTDLQFPSVLGKYFPKKTSSLLGDLPSELGINFRLTEWKVEAVINAAKMAHLAILPLDPSGTLNPLKAENRLLMMWRMGLPVLTSNSLAYSRVMNELGIPGICENSEEWHRKIDELLSSRDLRKEYVERGQAYIRKTHCEEYLLKSWDDLIESVV